MKTHEVIEQEMTEEDFEQSISLYEEVMQEEIEVKGNALIGLFKKYRSIGVVGNTDTAKSSLILTELIELKKQVNIPVYVLGIEPSLHKYLESKDIRVLHSVDDVLDLKIKSSIIYIDEVGDIYDSRMASKQTEKIRKFFNRLAHLNNYVIISTAQTKFWNAFICSLVKAYLVKEIEFDALVNGTLLKRKVKNITENTSEYRLDIPQNTFYVVTDTELTEKRTFDYDENVDTKKDMNNPFQNLDKNVEKNSGEKK